MVVIVYKIYPTDPPRLPEDLAENIVQVGEPWLATDLTHLMLVSPRWVYPVRKALYSAVYLHSSPRQWSLLTRTLLDSPECAAYISRVSLDEPPSRISLSPPSTTLYHALGDLRELFRCLIGLSSLRVAGPSGVATCLKALEALPNPDLLTELDIIGPPFGTRMTLPRMADRSLIWTESTPSTGLTHLKLTNVLLTFRMPPASRGLPPSITHLTLHDAEIPNVISLTTFPNQLKSLTVLTRTTRYMDPFSQVRSLVEHTRQSLEHFSHTMEHTVEGPWGVYRWVMPVCPKMRTLETDALLYAPRWFPNMEAAFPKLESWVMWQKPPEENKEDGDGVEIVEEAEES